MKSIEHVMNENYEARLAGLAEQELPLPNEWKGSIEDFLNGLRQGAAELFHAQYIDIEATFKDHFIAAPEDVGGVLEYYRVPYTITKKQEIQFGTPIKVKKETIWTKIEQRRARVAIEESERQRQRRLAGIEEQKEPRKTELTEEQRREQRLAGIEQEDYQIFPLVENLQGKRSELIETLFGSYGILESKQKGKVTVISGRAGKCDEATYNKRVYPRAILEKEVARLQPFIKQGRLLGQVDHPLDMAKGSTRLQDVGIKYSRLAVDRDGFLEFDGEILKTPKGDILQALLDGGVTVGISTRAWASTKKETRDGQELEIIQDDLEFLAIDAVSEPAAAGAEIQSYQ